MDKILMSGIVFLLIFICAMWYQKKRFEYLKKILVLDFSDFKAFDIIFSVVFAAIIAFAISFSIA
jgi:hypothetical protein